MTVPAAIRWVVPLIGARPGGYIVGATGSFVGAFLAAGIVLVIGIVAYVFILGRLEPIADPPAA
jgi:hypothetical protein